MGFFYILENIFYDIKKIAKCSIIFLLLFK